MAEPGSLEDEIMLTHNETVLDRIGSPAAIEGRHWATLTMSFLEDDDGHVRTVSVECLVPNGDAVTLGELREASRCEAIAILEAALATLRG
jgi:hypothetical protein